MTSIDEEMKGGNKVNITKETTLNYIKYVSNQIHCNAKFYRWIRTAQKLNSRTLVRLRPGSSSKFGLYSLRILRLKSELYFVIKR